MSGVTSIYLWLDLDAPLRFVSAVHIPKFAPSTLISGGGDPELKLWDWMSGEHLGDVPVLQAVEPYIVVRPSKGRVNQSEEDDEGEGTSAERGKRQGKSKKGKGRGKDKGQADVGAVTEEVVPVEAVESPVDVAMGDAGGEGKSEEQDVGTAGSSRPEEQPLVLVIRRIASVDASDEGQFAVFCAVG